MSNDPFPTTSVCMLNTLDIASLIEYSVGEYLIDPKTHLAIDNNKPPFVGRDIIWEYIQHILANHAAYTPNIPKEAFLGKYINPVLSVEAVMLVTEKIFDILLDISTDLNTFLRKDHWLMHFSKQSSTFDVIIEKSVDYRIHQWCIEHPIEHKRGERKHR